MTSSKTERVPLYKKVTNQLRAQCFASPGEMLPSLRQLSQTLEVNHATVSRALRDLEQEGLVEIVPRKGIFSLPRTSGEANIELVVLVSDHSNLLDVALCVSQGMQSECARASSRGTKLGTGRTVLPVAPFPEVERFVGDLKARGTTGVVFFGFGFFEGELAEQEDRFISEVARKIPVVLVGSPHSTLALDCVYPDPRQEMREFLAHCYDEGARRFEYLGEQDGNLLQLERRACFAEFMQEKGLGWAWDEFKTQDTLQLSSHLDGLPELPEVVVATNVRRATTVALEAQKRGLRLPGDLHILCFASLPEHAQPLLPYVSVIMLDEREVGRRAVQLLQQKASHAQIEVVTVRVPARFLSGPLLGVEEEQLVSTIASVQSEQAMKK